MSSKVESHQWLLDFDSQKPGNKSSHVQKWEAEDDIPSEGKVMALISDRRFDFGDVALW